MTMRAPPNVIGFTARTGSQPVRRFTVNPTSWALEVTMEYRAVVARALQREARRMKRAIYFKLFFLNLRKLLTQARYLNIALSRKFLHKLV